MKFKPLFGKKEEKDIDMVMADTKKRLIILKNKYEVTLQRELVIARENRKNGIRNSGNYSKIGVAYYSLNIINVAQQRLDELISTKELQNSMNEMGILLGLINGMPKKVGHMDSKKVLDGLKKMKGASAGAGKDLLKVLTDLSGADMKREDTTPVDTLVSVELIEKLIDGDDVERCVKNGAGLMQDTGEVMSAISELLNNGDVKSSIGPELSMDEINEMLEGL